MKNYGKSTNTNVARGGLSFLDLLAILFIALKLCGVITWPWVWVLAPIWGSIVLVIVVCIIVAIVTAIANN